MGTPFERRGWTSALQAAISSLQRRLSAGDVAILALSALSPVRSVYVTGAIILHMAGTGAAAALLVGGVIAILATLLTAELGAAFPRAGGVYPGIAAVLGRDPAFVAMTLGLVTAPATLALGSLGMADYLRALAPGLSQLGLAGAALGLAALLCVLNIRVNARLAAALLAMEVGGLVVLGALGLHPVRSLASVLAQPVMADGRQGLIATPLAVMPLAALSGAFACSGASLAIYFAEDMRGEPRRIGLVVAAVGLTAVLLVATPLVLLTLSAPDLPGTLAAGAPITAYLSSVAGSASSLVVTVLVAGAIFNNIVVSMLAFSRLLYATGRDGVWPGPVNAAVARLHGRFGSAWIASLCLAGAAVGLCLLGERRLLVLVSGEVFTAALVVVSVLVGRRRGLTGATTFRAPGFPMTPLFGLAVVAAIGWAEWNDPAVGRPSLLLLSLVAVGAFGYARCVRR